MGLVKMSALFERAGKLGVGCGSFSVYSMEAAMGAVRAAEELNTPVILQLAEARFKTAPLELMGPLMMSAARNAKVDIAVHLDHGNSLAVIEQALKMGFTSVMYDGSSKPFEENIKNTLIVKQMAKAYGADVEAELGLVGRSEGGEMDYGIFCTDPDNAMEFARRTEVEALAIAIGNQHGNYPVAPRLRFDILRDIHAKIPDLPLVLHGGSGISDEDFKKCIREGICKINIATAIVNEMIKEAENYLKKEASPDYYGLNRQMAEGACRTVRHHIEVFNMK